MAEQHRQICAWCEVELRPGIEPTSHGICGACGQSQLSSMEAVIAAEEQRRSLRGMAGRRGLLVGFYEPGLLDVMQEQTVRFECLVRGDSGRLEPAWKTARVPVVLARGLTCEQARAWFVGWDARQEEARHAS